MVLEDINIKVEDIMKDIGSKTYFKEKACYNMKMGIYIEENFKMDKNMVKGYIYIQMEINMKENLEEILEKVLEY
jgi:transcription antitermination factor NusG